MFTVLVSGSSGFVGMNLCKYLGKNFNLQKYETIFDLVCNKILEKYPEMMKEVKQLKIILLESNRKNQESSSREMAKL